MEIYTIWLTKLILSHLLTDFVLQPNDWIVSRKQKHFLSPHLYLHGSITAVVALLFIGFNYWYIAAIILVTHVIIDGWKSYRPEGIKYFLIDQALHIVVIVTCWYFIFFNTAHLKNAWQLLNTKEVWIVVTSFVFLTRPVGILIGQLTKRWRVHIPDADSLGDAGKWIGIIERMLILVFILNEQYASVGLLITAKSLLRFNEPNRLEVKTEYLLIGTLISFSIAVGVGIIALRLTHP
ncbi:MAG: DUF3307 domain-containing protein [Bacteroidota bacterium]